MLISHEALTDQQKLYLGNIDFTFIVIIPRTILNSSSNTCHGTINGSAKTV